MSHETRAPALSVVAHALVIPALLLDLHSLVVLIAADAGPLRENTCSSFVGDFRAGAFTKIVKSSPCLTFEVYPMRSVGVCVGPVLWVSTMFMSMCSAPPTCVSVPGVNDNTIKMMAETDKIANPETHESRSRTHLRLIRRSAEETANPRSADAQSTPIIHTIAIRIAIVQLKEIAAGDDVVDSWQEAQASLHSSQTIPRLIRCGWESGFAHRISFTALLPLSAPLPR